LIVLSCVRLQHYVTNCNEQGPSSKHKLILLSTARLHKLSISEQIHIAVRESRAVLAIMPLPFTGPAAGFCPQSFLNYGTLTGSCDSFSSLPRPFHVNGCT